jgi:CubicO group peptidase (beta-lactamase class C family)
MRLYEQNKFDLTKKVSDYLPELDSTNKQNILIKDVLAHQAQLTPWIPFYLKTIRKPEYKKLIYLVY